MSEEKYELNLDSTDETPENTEAAQASMTDDEKSLMDEMQALSNKCVEAGMPCFLVVKFPSQEDISAAWNFGADEVEAHKNFIEHFAPTLLHMTSQFTLTNIKATNPQTGATVYEVAPEKGEKPSA